MAIVSYKIFVEVLVSKAQSQAFQRRGSSEISDNSSSAEELVFIYGRGRLHNQKHRHSESEQSVVSIIRCSSTSDFITLDEHFIISVR